jgi:hypothetical protein
VTLDEMEVETFAFQARLSIALSLLVGRPETWGIWTCVVLVMAMNFVELWLEITLYL